MNKAHLLLLLGIIMPLGAWATSIDVSTNGVPLIYETLPINEGQSMEAQSMEAQPMEAQPMNEGQSMNEGRSKEWVDEGYILEGYSLLNSHNPSGLNILTQKSLSKAWMGGELSKGGLVNYYESDDAFRFSVGARSYFRFNSRIVMRGEIFYELIHGKNMSGSVFLNPEFQVFDILEITDENRGLKKVERYHVNTSLSYNVYKGLSLGFGFDFVSANYAKMKDLRYSNTCSDMKVDLGLNYDFKRVSIGGTYHYRKNVEGLAFERFSGGDTHYELLLSYGPFWGKRKSFEENVGMISSSRIPIKNILHGGSLQLDIRPNSQCEFFFEGLLSSRHCDLGHKSPNTILYNTFAGLEYSATARALFHLPTQRHALNFNFVGRSMTSYENVYKIVHHPSGENETIYYDPKSVSQSHFNSFSLSYRGDFMIRDSIPLVSCKVSARVDDRKCLSTLYPYWKSEHLLPFYASLYGQGQIPYRQNLFKIGLALGYSGAFICQENQGSYIPNPSQMTPISSDLMHGRQLEFLTSPQIHLNPSFTYSRSFKHLILSAGLDYRCSKALTPLLYLRGDFHHCAQLFIELGF